MVQKVVCSGSSYALGQEYGLQCHELIGNCIDEVEAVLGQRLRVEPRLIFERAEEYFQPSIVKNAPHLWQELAGLADATGQPIAKLLFLQAFSEFLSTVFPENIATAVTGHATTNGSSLVAANLDFIDEMLEKYLLVREIRPDNAPKMLLLTFAGSLGFAGVNELGLAAVSTGLESSGIQKGLPTAILVRLALEKVQLSEMVDLITEAPRAIARGYLLAGRLTCANLETTISQVTNLQPSHAGVLIHANHFLADEFKELDLGQAKWPESSDRYQRCYNLVHEKLPLTPTELAEVLSDHVHHPKGICRHDCDSQKGAKTIASVIIRTAAPELMVCIGSPCRGKFTSYGFNIE